MPELPGYIELLWVALVAMVLGAWLRGIWLASRLAGYSPEARVRISVLFAFLSCMWLLLTGTLASKGAFLDAESMPPKILLVAGPSVIIGIVLSFTRTARELLSALPTHYIIGAQSFRLGVEVIFYLLLVHHAIPELMTFEGRNMDIFVGLSAIPVAMLARKGKLSDTMLIVWNILSLAILLNVMIHGILSSPSAIQQIQTTPVNNFMLHFPYVWLLSLLVPTAFAGHVLSLRQIAIKRKEQAHLKIELQQA